MKLSPSAHEIAAEASSVASRLPVVLCGLPRLLMENLTESIRREPDFELVGVIDQLEQLPSTGAANPCVVLIADQSPDESQVVEPASALPIKSVQLLLSDRQRSLAKALQQPSAGYVTLSDAVSDFLAVVREVAHGGRAISPSLRSRIQWDDDARKYAMVTNHVFESLSKRQLEILARIARGDSVKEVARDLDLSQKAVDCHKYRIMQKLGLHDRVQITRLAIREGLLNP